jgi:hypothetical protein
MPRIELLWGKPKGIDRLEGISATMVYLRSMAKFKVEPDPGSVTRGRSSINLAT